MSLEKPIDPLYNIFIIVNILNAPEEKISLLLHTLGQPVRIRILLAISDDEACVCHLETMLGLRQAYISQHLMAMRNAGILTTRRDGRFIFYQLKNKQLLDLTKLAGKIVGINEEEIDALLTHQPIPQCCCPKCVARNRQSSSFDTDEIHLIHPPTQLFDNS